MMKSECPRISAVPEASGAAWAADASLFDPTSAAIHSSAMEFPLLEYLRVRRKLTYDAVYHPLGYPVRVVSNSPLVLQAAGQSWGGFNPSFQGEALEVLLEVTPHVASGGGLPPAPAHIVVGSLLLEFADMDNFFIADLKRGRTMARVTPAAVACPRYLRYFFLEAAALSMISNLRAIAVHAACVSARGKGILFCADSGEGKSTLAYAGARAGWTYVSDDATYVPLDTDERVALGNYTQVRFRPSAVELFPELAGRPTTPRAAGKPSIEVPTSELPGLATAHTTHVDHIVFLNRRFADTQQLVPLRSSTVWPWFKQHLISPPEMRPRQETAFSRLLSAGIFELQYRNLDWAIDRINQLATKGL